MKIITAALVILLASVANALDYERPNRPSFGLTCTRLDLQGNFYHNSPWGIINREDSRETLTTVALDTIWPIFDHWALTGSAGRAFKTHNIADIPTIENGSSEHMDGYTVSVGLRMYL